MAPEQTLVGEGEGVFTWVTVVGDAHALPFSVVLETRLVNKYIPAAMTGVEFK